MEPLSALALSGNLLQFIECAGTLLSEARQVCQSESGFTASSRDALAVYHDFRTAADDLTARSLRPAPADSAAVISLAERCQELSDELVQRLQNLQATNPGSKRESLRAAWRSLRDKGELDALEKRLGRHRQQLITRIIFMLSRDQSSTFQLLQESRSQAEYDGIKTSKQLENLRRELLAVAQHVEKLGDEQRLAVEDQQNSTTKMAELITSLVATRDTLDRETCILAKLKFPGIQRREVTIEPARAGTYRWLLYPPGQPPPSDRLDSAVDPKSRDGNDDDELLDALLQLRKAVIHHYQSVAETGPSSQRKDEARKQFTRWLRSGSGIFYLSGKAGSGKSTMMKFLTRDSGTKEMLAQWAGTRQLVFASFFFWNSGLEIQRSVEGLYRSLLWEMLRTCPSLIPAAFPREWALGRTLDREELSLERAEEAFGRVLEASAASTTHRICLFIDGLDEFEGDHWKLSKVLKTWSESSHVKLCVSSRPYNDFEKAFNTDPAQCIRLQELNFQDMIQVALEEFGRGEKAGESYAHLVKPAVEKANGVFLWLRLASRHLARGIRAQYSAEQLRAILQAMPDDVTAMFQGMLDRLLGRPDRVSVAITLLCLSDPTLPRANHQRVLFFAAMDDVLDGSTTLDDLAGAQWAKPVSDEVLQERLAVTEARLRGRCEDFIDVHESKDERVPQPLRRYVEFVHRDLRDFLTQEHAITKLYRATGWMQAKVAGLHRYLGLVLLRMVPALTTKPWLLAPIADEFLRSDSTTAEELELLLTVILRTLVMGRSGRKEPSTAGLRKDDGYTSIRRHCTILAIRDNIDAVRIEKVVFQDQKEPKKLMTNGMLDMAFSLLTAAAFHRHTDYVLRLVAGSPLVLELSGPTNLLLSATLGGAAASAVAASQQRAQVGTAVLAPKRTSFRALVDVDFAVNPGGVGGLLYPSKPIEVNFGGDRLGSWETSSKMENLNEDGGPDRTFRRGPGEPLALMHGLLDKGAAPNLRLRCGLSAWPGTWWTPWKATLLGTAGVMRRGEMMAVLPDIMEAYLSHGADPTMCFVGRYLPKHKLKPLPVYHIGPGIYTTTKLEAHMPRLFKDDDGWYYLTLAQVVELFDDDHPKKQAVLNLLHAKAPWAVTRWISQAMTTVGGRGRAASQVSKLELEQLGTSYFFVSMIVREQDLNGLEVPEEAKKRLLPGSLIPI